MIESLKIEFFIIILLYYLFILFLKNGKIVKLELYCCKIKLIFYVNKYSVEFNYKIISIHFKGKRKLYIYFDLGILIDWIKYYWDLNCLRYLELNMYFLMF
jgi:hypothetical protein